MKLKIEAENCDDKFYYQSYIRRGKYKGIHFDLSFTIPEGDLIIVLSGDSVPCGSYKVDSQEIIMRIIDKILKERRQKNDSSM